MTKRHTLPITLQLLSLLNTLILVYAWSRSLLGRPLPLGNQQMTWWGLIYWTSATILLLGGPWLANRLALEPFDYLRMTTHLAAGWLGYQILLLVVPVWFQPANSGLVSGVAFGLIGGLCMDMPRNLGWGVRISWTFKSPVVWHKTNWLVGLLLLLASYGMVAIGWLWPVAFPWYLLISVIGILLLAVGYAWYLNHQ
ncbi:MULTISPECIES: SdpI family protein [Lactiplantibacillus]|nr:MULTISPECIES: SdpI family protein [Lactiplantibacillus]